MAQLDRLLTQVITKAGSRLEVKADRKPRLELKSGEAIELLPNPLPTVMVDVLAGDVVPPELKAAWQKNGQAEFDYDLSGQSFRIRLSRYMDLPQIQAEHQGPSRPPATPAPKPTAVMEVAPAPKAVPGAPPAAPAAPRPQAPRTEPVARKTQTHPLAEKLLATLVEKQGSDLHCTTHEPPLARIHGDVDTLPVDSPRGGAQQQQGAQDEQQLTHRGSPRGARSVA